MFKTMGNRHDYYLRRRIKNKSLLFIFKKDSRIVGVNILYDI